MIDGQQGLAEEQLVALQASTAHSPTATSEFEQEHQKGHK